MENTTNPNRKALQEACSLIWKTISKSDTTYRDVQLTNGWVLRGERVYRRGCIGPAWKASYTLISPTGKLFGGYDTAASFSSYFGNPNGWQWIDAYNANGFKKAGK